MLILEKNAYRIFTDSGGVQKEAYLFKVPYITLRDETEWVETVDAGWNVLAGHNPEQIVQLALEAKPEADKTFPYGDGRAAERIVELLGKSQG